jgi:hypothetical protein
MTKELNSGVYSSLRARCAECGQTIAAHPYCSTCGRPRRCREDGWVEHDADILCPTCVHAKAG